MSDALERDTVIELLEKLGSDQDEEVLAAARTLHNQVTEAGVPWDDLLVDEDSSTPDEDSLVPDEEATTISSDVDDDDAGEMETVSNFSGDDSQTPELIAKLLAREGNSDSFREELEDYKTDLANGDLAPSDHQYIRALYQRLSKTS